MSILEKILESKKKRLREDMEALPLAELRNQVLTNKDLTNQDLRKSFQPFGVIGEIKRASPSKGRIPWRLCLPELVRSYEEGGVSLISVLTEEDYFQGGKEDFRKVRSLTQIPLLRKDFIFREYQIWESAYLGANMILLIASLYDLETLTKHLKLTKELGMDALIECSTAQEVLMAIEAGGIFLGINNRDLKTFQVSLQATEKLASLIPSHCLLISESGIHSPEDAFKVALYGAQGILVGESCVRSPNPSSHIRSLLETGLKAKGVQK
ncbi:MAG: indole-3-glycerol phosphate synthase TrpC [Desulfitobacterium sp.]|nr:indole-3-glycerol phosphate synthase TrpC [Desulfitobacterium sp.]